ncbi:hypothetical protein LN650_13140 [Klebsiella pneumoniae subsp. pneumoniae]|nr:hypothetical protein [Klebsiella pneumoniae subsp. pneumoniae]
MGYRQQRLSAAAGCGHFSTIHGGRGAVPARRLNPRLKSLIFTPRGGVAPGTNGQQALNGGIIVEYVPHSNRIIVDVTLTRAGCAVEARGHQRSS